jgi:metallo-beta-lactamase family protein
MKLMFSGADHEVTGSCHIIEACGKYMLVDYGMEQGADYYPNAPLPVPESQIDCVFLTHAHIDHSGLLPLLYAKGFRGSIFATAATCALCAIMLKDSAHIQEFEAEWRNRKGKRAGKKEIEPLYTVEDAEKVSGLFVECEYKSRIHVCDGVDIEFVDVGHLLGSASIEVWLNENGVEKKLVFSGDIGNLDQPIIKDPEYIDSADIVIMESTYGDRVHEVPGDYVGELVKIIKETFDRGGNLVIPSFAVGRTQELLYFIRKIKEDNMIKEYPDFEVYVDSPLAIDATSIFTSHIEECFDEDALKVVHSGINPLSFPGLKIAVSPDDSKNINFDVKPKIIISASGMCEAGRIKHHLKHNLWRPECTIMFVGYQAAGTLGRSILEGAKQVKLFGEPIEVEAQIKNFKGISGHADKNGLLKWINAYKVKPSKVFVVHGQDEVCSSFAECLKNEYGFDAVAPYTGSVYDIATGECLETGNSTLLTPSDAHKGIISTVFARLVSAGERLMTVIKHNEGGTNKDLAKFADQINSLCDKWDR